MSSLTVYAPQITILDNVVNMIDGLYSLKDLHKASGGDNKHAPFRFMRNAETKELIVEIERSPDVVNGNDIKAYKVVKGGSAAKQGTYACKELVYRYAMWISPKFALLVIRTFDKLVTGELKVQGSQLTAEQTLPLRNAVNKLVGRSGIMYPEGYKIVHQQFGVKHIKDLTLEQLSQAVEYVHDRILNLNVESAPISSFTHNQYIMNVKHEVMDYVYSLQKVIVDSGNKLPNRPDFDTEEISRAFIVSMIQENRMTLSFDHDGKPNIGFVPKQHAIVSHESLASVVQFAHRSQLPSIINAAVERLGK
ncbi:KilA-N domain-containing protein [Psychrobacter sp. JB193]|uniref:KilA-N domain-containing protein n=1 Tax=Psychrobacter sp. JB193 TaxID=2024406 RepID=UPI000BAAEA67|nr:KilA-N domain-containing protein [Psychrobacter sp. JB193]PAT63923.1 hypothetical protein CIK80_02090 [Psychrobacter sp. JB193]